MSMIKVGGIRFMRLGRLQLSFCVMRRKPVLCTLHVAGQTIHATYYR